MTPETMPYQAYILRLWPVTNRGQTTWRCSLQCVRGGEQRGFVDLASLCAYLRQQTEAAAAGADTPGETTA